MSLLLPGTRWVVLIDWEIAPGEFLRISSEPYCTKPTDTPANTEYIPALLAFPWSLSASAVVHRSGGGASPLTYMDLANIGGLSVLVHKPLRDTAIGVFYVQPGAAYSTRERVADCYGDRVESATVAQLRVKLRTIMDKMKRPIGDAFDNGDSVGQMKAPCFGDVDFTDGQNHDDANGQISVSADSFWGFRAVMAGGVDTLDYVRSTSIFYDGADYGSVTGRRTVGVAGVMWGRQQMIDNSNLANWTGGYPDDFTIVENPTDSGVERVGSSDLVRIYSFGSLASISQATLTIGRSYFAAVTCNSAIDGALQVMCGATVLLTISAAGIYRFGFVAGATDFTIRRSALEASSDVVLSSVSCTWVQQTNRIDYAVYHILHNRMFLDSADLDSASVDAVATAAPWRLGFQVDGQTDLHAVLRQALDNVCGDAFASLLNIVHIGRLRDPAGETPVASFDDASIKAGTVVTVRQDEAVGLRNRLRYRYNHAVHTDADLVTTDPARRLLLKTEYLTASSTVQPSVHYAESIKGEPRQSWIREGADAISQIEVECGLFDDESPALFVDFVASCDPRIALDTLRPFAPVSLRYPVPGFEYGRLLLAMAVSGDLLQPYEVKVMGWSPSQPGTLLLDDGGELLADDGGGIELG